MGAVPVEVKISTEYITLGQFLKHIDRILTGGEAKFFLSSHDVEVNGEIVRQRGKKLFPGDRIKIAADIYIVR